MSEEQKQAPASPAGAPAQQQQGGQGAPAGHAQGGGHAAPGAPVLMEAASEVRVAKAPPQAPVVPARVRAASASISARKKSASSASRRWTSSTTSAPIFF